MAPDSLLEGTTLLVPAVASGHTPSLTAVASETVFVCALSYVSLYDCGSEGKCCVYDISCVGVSCVTGTATMCLLLWL